MQAVQTKQSIRNYVTRAAIPIGFLSYGCCCSGFACSSVINSARESLIKTRDEAMVTWPRVKVIFYVFDVVLKHNNI